MTKDSERPAADWREEKMRIDDREGDPHPPVGRAAGPDDVGAETAERDDVAGWNKEQMAIEREGETPRRMDPDAMPESEEGPTGGRSNPGGGERFGDFDDTGRRRS